MIFAVIGDIKGNFTALEAVIKAVDDIGIDIILHTGNCAVGYAEGNQTIEMMQARNIISIQGGMDRHLVYYRRDSNRTLNLEPEEQASLASANEFVSTTNIEYLRALPRQRYLTLEGIEILLCHGSPTSPFTFLSSQTPLIRFEREREKTGASIVLSSTSNKSYYKWVSGTLFVGAAPLSEELLTPEASYLLINTDTKPWSVKFCQAPITVSTSY